MEKKSVTVLQKFSTCVLFCVLLLSSAATAVAYNPFSIHPEKETITDGNTYEIHFDEYVDPSFNFNFSVCDNIFITNDGSVLFFNNISEGNNNLSKTICAHIYKTGTALKHTKLSNNKCLVTMYNITACTNCNHIKSQTKIREISYSPCPH